MSTVSIDHIAMPTANAENLIGFYKRLGLRSMTKRIGELVALMPFRYRLAIPR